MKSLPAFSYFLVCHFWRLDNKDATWHYRTRGGETQREALKECRTLNGRRLAKLPHRWPNRVPALLCVTCNPGLLFQHTPFCFLWDLSYRPHCWMAQLCAAHWGTWILSSGLTWQSSLRGTLVKPQLVKSLLSINYSQPFSMPLLQGYFMY